VGYGLEMIDVVNEIKGRKNSGQLNKRRVVCAHCGKTWIELVGVIVSKKDGVEDIYLRVGTESENCQVCRFRTLECPKCGSKDVFEIKFAEEIPDEVPLSFRDIKKVSRGA
jgi:transposase-like protein